MSTSLPQENEFIQAQLHEWGIIVEAELRYAMGKYKIGVTNDLLRSLKFQVMSATGANKGSLKLYFNEYGRFVDMGRGKGYGIAETSATKNAIVEKSKSSHHRKPKKWYSKKFYGNLNKLVNALAYNYSTWSAENIKKSFES